MKRYRLWLAIVALLAAATTVAGSTHNPSLIANQSQQERRRPPSPSTARPQPRAELTALTGRVTQIHAPRLFTVQRTTDQRELLVFAPRELSPEFSGATVSVEGTVRRFTDAELGRIAGWNEIDAKLRERFSGQPILVASSLMAMVGGEKVERVHPEPMQTPESAEPLPSRLQRGVERADTPLAIRATVVADHIAEFAGRPLRVLEGRVVGVLEPRAFLIEPATSYLKAMGSRDRMLVLIESASLRVSPELLVGSIVTVTGVVRTLLGIQVTGELPWPTKLDPEEVDRLEVRGALLATSVQTGEGVELTDRPVQRSRN